MDAALDGQLDRECERFLYREAELLDARRFHDWLALLSPSIDYRVPVRTTRENKDGTGFSDKAFFMEEDYASLKMRVLRLDSDSAWAENPATRTRRLVGNVRAQAGNGADECSVASNMAVYCFRGESVVPVTLTGERRDLLRRIDGQWRLHSRLVLLDTTVLGMDALSIFL